LLATVGIAAVLLGLSLVPLQAQECASLNNGPWKLAPQTDVKETGEQLSTPGYATEKWVEATVPGTVFGSYVNAGLEPDPNYGDNAWKVDVTKYQAGRGVSKFFWYRTEFTVPADYFKGGRIWLNLDGVNRDADVYLNGTKVGVMKGFFQRGRFDVTALVKNGGKNVMAVLASTPPAWGYGHANGASPTLICSCGWDWMPAVPDRNCGIYKDVYLSRSGDISLHDPWIRSELPKLTEADLSVQMELTNSSSSPVSGELVGEINPGKIAFKKAVTLKPGETQTVMFKVSDTPALHISNPKLWWPNGYGEPNLYTCRLEFRTGDKVSDQKKVTFGIKKYTYLMKGDWLTFCINGAPLFLKGGNWGMAEYLLRCKASDYDTRIRFHKEMNFNVIRNWMGMTPDEAFYEACDKYGIMVWDELWLNSKGGNPSDLGVYFANVVEKVKRFRNHPSIAFWCAMNENEPKPEVNEPLAEIIRKYDGGDRQYQPNSRKGGLSGSGGWANAEPKAYFKSMAGGGALTKQAFGLRSELGMATFTSFDSFKKFMPKETWWPANEMWNKHYFGENAGHAGPDKYVASLGSSYGEASDIEDFCRKAQLLNLETMKAMFEGFLDHSGVNASGLLIWMSQSAYPSFVWQTYDYYYDTTGAYWGAKTACEPVHVYWNCNDDNIRVVNNTCEPVENLKAELRIYNMDGSKKGYQTATVKVPNNAVADCFKLQVPADVSATHFLKLRLTDSSGKVVSENFYWRGTTYLDYFGLSSLKPVKLVVTEPKSEALSNGMTKMTLDITNPADSGAVALAIRPKPVKPSNGEQVLPVFMNDGYFSLIPGETKRITIEYHAADAGGEKPKVVVECWNNFPHPMPTKPAATPTPTPKLSPKPAKQPALSKGIPAPENQL